MLRLDTHCLRYYCIRNHFTTLRNIKRKGIPASAPQTCHNDRYLHCNHNVVQAFCCIWRVCFSEPNQKNTNLLIYHGWHRCIPAKKNLLQAPRISTAFHCPPLKNPTTMTNFTYARNHLPMSKSMHVVYNIIPTYMMRPYTITQLQMLVTSRGSGTHLHRTALLRWDTLERRCNKARNSSTLCLSTSTLFLPFWAYFQCNAVPLSYAKGSSDAGNSDNTGYILLPLKSKAKCPLILKRVDWALCHDEDLHETAFYW